MRALTNSFSRKKTINLKGKGWGSVGRGVKGGGLLEAAKKGGDQRPPGRLLRANTMSKGMDVGNMLEKDFGDNDANLSKLKAADQPWSLDENIQKVKKQIERNAATGEKQEAEVTEAAALRTHPRASLSTTEHPAPAEHLLSTRRESRPLLSHAAASPASSFSGGRDDRQDGGQSRARHQRLQREGARGRRGPPPPSSAQRHRGRRNRRRRGRSRR